MINAANARKQTETNLKNGTTPELKKLEDLITKAIDDGKCSVSVDGRLRNETEKQLNELGYEVKVCGMCYDQGTIISW